MVLLNVQPPSVIKDIQEIEESGAEIIDEIPEGLEIFEEFIDENDEIQFPPTNLYSDEPPLESDFHREQINLLIRLLKYRSQGIDPDQP